jgi:hypothetical protein
MLKYDEAAVDGASIGYNVVPVGKYLAGRRKARMQIEIWEWRIRSA